MTPENLTQREAASRLGISPRQLRRLTSEGVVSRADTGAYPWPLVRTEYDAHRRTVEGGGSGDATEALIEARVRRLQAQAEASELDLAQKRRDLIEVRDVEALVTRSLGRVARALSAVPQRHAARLASEAMISNPAARRILADIVELVKADIREAPRE